MSKSNRRPKLSEDEIHAMYRQGEAAVVSLVTQLLDRLDAVESRLEALEKRTRKTSRNSHKPPSGDGFGKRTKSLRVKSDKPSGGNPDIRAPRWSGVRPLTGLRCYRFALTAL